MIRFVQQQHLAALTVRDFLKRGAFRGVACGQFL